MSVSIESIGFVGGGQMAEAMIRGILASGLVKADKITVAEPTANRCELLQGEYGVACTTDPETLCASSSVIVLAIKPQLAPQVLEAYQPHVGDQHLLISIMAGVPLASLAGLLGQSRRLIRVMPNTPALVLAAATAFSPNENAGVQDRAIAQCPVFRGRQLRRGTGKPAGCGDRAERQRAWLRVHLYRGHDRRRCAGGNSSSGG